MKNTSLKKKGAAAAMITAMSIAYLGLAQQAEAGVTWLVSDDGTNLILTTDGGTMDFSPTFNSGLNPGTQGKYQDDSTTVLSLNTSYKSAGGRGQVSGNDPWISSTATTNTNVSGDTFGFLGTAAFWDPSLGNAPGVFVPNSTMTFTSLTVADAFGSNLDAGPVVLWTHDVSGDFIAVGFTSFTVPEPSSAALLGLGAVGLLLRRRR